MTSKWLPLTHTELLRWKAQQVRVAQDSYEVNNKEEKTMTNNEYEYIIKQQKEIIKQQKDLIDKLLANEYVCLAPKDATCDNKCDSCCYSAPLC